MFSILPVFWAYAYPGIVEFSGADRVRCFLAEPSCQAVLKRTSNALTICQFILTGQPVSLHSVISFFHSCRMHQSYQNLRYSLPHPMIVIRIQFPSFTSSHIMVPPHTWYNHFAPSPPPVLAAHIKQSQLYHQNPSLLFHPTIHLSFALFPPSEPSAHNSDKSSHSKTPTDIPRLTHK